MRYQKEHPLDHSQWLLKKKRNEKKKSTKFHYLLRSEIYLSLSLKSTSSLSITLFVTIYIIYIIHLKVHIFINADLNLVKYLSKTRHDLSSLCEKKASLNK